MEQSYREYIWILSSESLKLILNRIKIVHTHACKRVTRTVPAPSTRAVIDLRFASAMTVPVNPVCPSIRESPNVILSLADQNQHSVLIQMLI